MNWYLNVLKKYAVFSGRARRKEYWMFYLFNMIFFIAASFLDVLLSRKLSLLPSGIILIMYILAMILPALAVTIRRLHDTNRNGAWIFIALVPFIGGIWLIVLLASFGNEGENKYGPDPKGQPSFDSDALDSHLAN